MEQEGSPETMLALVVKAVGSQSAYARLVGKSQPWVHDCLQKHKQIVAEHVPIVEEATGISRHDLRPDLFPREGGSVAPSTASTVLAREPGALSDRASSAP